MFTEPEIVSSKDLNTRAYVKVYIDGKRHRFYNGKPLGITCNPNNAKSVKDRDKALVTLSYKLKKKLEAGWRPDQEPPQPKQHLVKKVIAGETIESLVKELQTQDLSDLYKRDLLSVGDAFVGYLKTRNLFTAPIDQIDTQVADSFLKQYNHSATYYMNKRRTLGAIFSRLVKGKVIPQNPLKETTKLKEKATLHEAYTKEQLRKVLGILEDQHPNLHLCALLMYGCFLRPHQEVRNLFRSHFNPEVTTISLSGDSNKSGRVRTVYVPPYVRDALIKYNTHKLDAGANLFTRTCDVFNESYFNTAWSRVKETMIEEGVLTCNHTLYSFRHTAAINLYMKTKDLYKVQQAMGHSSMTVTLTYMRSLGVINNISSDDAPEL